MGLHGIFLRKAKEQLQMRGKWPKQVGSNVVTDFSPVGVSLSSVSEGRPNWRGANIAPGCSRGATDVDWARLRGNRLGSKK